MLHCLWLGLDECRQGIGHILGLNVQGIQTDQLIHHVHVAVGLGSHTGSTQTGYPITQQVGHSRCIAQQAWASNASGHVAGQLVSLLHHSAKGARVSRLERSLQTSDLSFACLGIGDVIERSVEVAALNQGSQIHLGHALEHRCPLVIRWCSFEGSLQHGGQLLLVELACLGHQVAGPLDQVIHIGVGGYPASQVLDQGTDGFRHGLGVGHGQHRFSIGLCTSFTEQVGCQFHCSSSSLHSLGIGAGTNCPCFRSHLLRGAGHGIDHPVIALGNQTGCSLVHLAHQVFFLASVVNHGIRQSIQRNRHIGRTGCAHHRFLDLGQQVVAHGLQLLIQGSAIALC